MKQSKLKSIDNGLFLYGGLVTFTLIGIALYNIQSKTSLLTLVLFLPVAFYFLVRIFSILNKSLHRFLNKDNLHHPYFGDFSLATFLSQNDYSFLFNLFLLALAISAIFFRISLNLIK
jgi:hypothetical protein